ncbi:MAG TPA: DMT family transporter [Jatrophihabitans sp.]|nr:DMT family transporter [Jatrophihabitans sp.]
MSTSVAIPFAVGSAIVYGTSAVVQHHMAQQFADGQGRSSAEGLWRLVRNPVWLLAVCGDFFGFILQVIALANGPVVIVQPLVVLMLPVSLFVSAALGWHAPRPGELLGVLGVVSGLAIFLSLVGQPGAERVPGPIALATTVLVVLAAAALACVAVTGRHRVVRAAVYGAAGGSYFGTLAVLVDAASERTRHAGLHGLLTTPRGLIPLIGIAFLGVGGIVLTQMSFQIGALGATLPANLSADPLTAVLMGELLLRERIPLSPGHIAAYLLCLIAVIGGGIRLAEQRSELDAPPASSAAASPA